MDIKENIIEKVACFIEHQKILKVTMDDIATALKMSKKTIYKYFTSKDELIQAVIWIKIQYIRKTFEQITSKDINAIEKFICLTDFILHKGLKFLIIFLDQIAQMCPEWWQKIEDFRSRVLRKNIALIVEQGKKEGLIIYRETEIIINVYLTTIRGVINPSFLKKSKLPPKQIISTTIEILFRGILTVEGVRIYNKLKKERRNEI